ncbi:longitudinals lacking protein, isoforms A/B/D/L isoform X3 [Sabethes cyaneus]|uniref:longitudinals lacking protein, isoforms A/B/D/L isoform X3 n=1 Tax=Sabethes cyaneus TaxID=53552 RepID=UPI00237E3BBA|nr:longitudinals lacking protein, isoforms A/B/D/L isoform X3 [Sabethes cyaneus]
MDDDQQFCLRWNNHQSTLISVFDTLLENGTLVDCTLAAEGKFLKAHKVVLSACSPYFAALLSQQYDKHPIFILKDVKFQELRAMMDYMYRGEVNISQDQLAALLKAAESLQIKGLSDNRGSSSAAPSQQSKPPHSETSATKTLPPPVPANKASGLTIENKRPLKPELLDSDVSGSREGSTSPTSRKRKKIRRRSVDNNNLIDNHDQHSNSSSHSMHTSLQSQALALTSSSTVAGVPTSNNTATSLSSSSTAPSNSANVLTTPAAVAAAAAVALKKTDSVQQQQVAEALKLQLVKHQSQQQSQQQQQQSQQQQVHHTDDDERSGTEQGEGQGEPDSDDMDEAPQAKRHQPQATGVTVEGTDSKSINQSELMIEPKNEYDDGQDENVEDLTLDEEELLDDLDQAGPSHGGEGSSQGYAQWQMEREQNEAFMAAQDAVGGQHRDAQEPYSMLHTLLSEPNKLDYPQNPYANEVVIFNDDDSMNDGQGSHENGITRCSNCKRVYPSREKLQHHIKKYCLKEKKYQCMFCQYRSKRKDHIVRHTDRMHPSQMQAKLYDGTIKCSTEAFLQLDPPDTLGYESGDNCLELFSVSFSEDFSRKALERDYNRDVATTADDSIDYEDSMRHWRGTPMVNIA